MGLSSNGSPKASPKASTGTPSSSNEFEGGRSHDVSGSSTSKSVQNVRLNPAVVKKRGLKLTAQQSATEGRAEEVINLNKHLGSRGGLAPVDDSDLEKNRKGLKIKVDNVPKDSKRMFTGLFVVPGDTGGCSGRRGQIALQSRENHKMPPKRVKWWQVTLYVLNDVNEAWLMLFSALTLAINGWVVGMLIIITLWPVNVYVAHLLWRCRNIFPGAISLGDLVYYATRSNLAMYVTFFFVNVTIAIGFAYNIIVAASNLYWLSGFTSERCLVVFLGVVCLVLLPMTQLRTLHSLTIINLIDLICMLCFAAIYMYFLAGSGREAGAQTSVGPSVKIWQDFFVIDKDAEVKGIAFSGIHVMINAYHYQILLLEIMAEMKDPREFPKANYWCTPVILLVTVGCSSFAYYFQGATKVLALVMPLEVISSAFDRSQAALAYFGVLCFAIKMLGSCLIKSVILTRFMQLLIHPQMANARTWRSRFEWLAISLVIVGIGYLLSIAASVFLPIATVLLTLTFGLGFLLPVMLYIVCKRQRKQLHQIPWFEWLFMSAIVTVSTAMIILHIFRMVISDRGDSYLSSQQNNYTVTHFSIITDCSAF